MKKNNVMRVFSLLLALTLISVCAISGTFAKYVTKAEGQDHARVAKWGVLINVEGNAFSDKYAAEDESYLAAGGTYSVEAFAEDGEEADQVVAPGTNSELVGKTLKASVTGKPEVAARYEIKATNLEDVYLEKGTYADPTGFFPDGEFTLEADYSPIKWDLTISKGGRTVSAVQLLKDALPEGNYEQAVAYGLTDEGCSIHDAIAILKKVAGNDGYVQIVNDALGSVVSGGRNFQLDVADNGDLTLSYDFDPNKDMGFTFELTWSWAFEETAEIEDADGTIITVANPIVDAADTYLGNVAAGVTTDAKAHTTIAATVVATATQID